MIAENRRISPTPSIPARHMELDYNDIDSYKRAAAARYATPLKIESAIPLCFLRASRRGESREFAKIGRNTPW